MSLRSRLAVLLALRTAERDRAAGELARATARVRDGEAVVARTRAALERLDPQRFAASAASPVLGVHELRAITAARLSASSMLDELRSADASARGELAGASRDFTAASTRLRALERLDERAREAQRAELLAREQAVIDEIAQHRREENA